MGNFNHRIEIRCNPVAFEVIGLGTGVAGSQLRDCEDDCCTCSCHQWVTPYGFSRVPSVCWHFFICYVITHQHSFRLQGGVPLSQGMHSIVVCADRKSRTCLTRKCPHSQNETCNQQRTGCGQNGCVTRERFNSLLPGATVARTTCGFRPLLRQYSGPGH